MHQYLKNEAIGMIENVDVYYHKNNKVIENNLGETCSES